LGFPLSATFGGSLADEIEYGLGPRGNDLSPFPFGQGVTLRGVGAGSLGTRVLLDGVPVNDPFGGWVNWAALQHDAETRELPTLTKEEIVRYSRHLIMPEVGVDGQRKIKAAKVPKFRAGKALKDSVN